MQPYHVYSDASARTRTAVAVCVISPKGDVHAAALPVDAKHIVAAEIRGCCLGLMMTPIGAEVVLHSDIDDLLSLYVDESRISYGAKFSSELTALRRLGKLRRITIVRAKGEHYLACHDAARRVAKKTA